MIVDSSALIAMLYQEPEAERLARALAHARQRAISAANWLETSMVTFLRGGEEAVRDMDVLVAKFGLETVPVSATHAAIARRAFMRYGKAIHPARLNFGDCMAYALAKERNEPLLFKGSDFTQTDVLVAAY
jgi:ribonuclease VapC